MDSLPNFLTHGAPLCALRAREELRYKLIDKNQSEVKHRERRSALQNKTKTHKKILPLETEYRPSVPSPKNIVMDKWHLIENQPLLREIFKDPPIIFYKK